MAQPKKNAAKQAISYHYGDKRKNDPPAVGMVYTVSHGEERRTYEPYIASTPNFDPVRAKVENSKEIKTGLDESLPVRFEGSQSPPFESSNNRHFVGKIADNRGVESLKALDASDCAMETEL